MRRAVFSPEDLKFILTVLREHHDMVRSYVGPGYLLEVERLYDRVVNEHNYLIKPVKPRREKDEKYAGKREGGR